MSGVASASAAAGLAAAVCLAATPYLAGLTRTVPDRGTRAWWRGAGTTRTQRAGTAVVAAPAGLLAGLGAGWRPELAALLALALICTPLVLIDIEHHRLPDRLVAGAAVAGTSLLALASAVTGQWFALARAGACAAIVFVALLVLALLSPRSFGLGDVKLGAVLGGYLGWFGWGLAYAGIAAGFLVGALVALALLVSRRVGLRTQLAFGPTLILGALLALGAHGALRGG